MSSAMGILLGYWVQWETQSERHCGRAPAASMSVLPRESRECPDGKDSQPSLPEPDCLDEGEIGARAAPNDANGSAAAPRTHGQ